MNCASESQLHNSGCVGCLVSLKERKNRVFDCGAKSWPRLFAKIAEEAKQWSLAGRPIVELVLPSSLFSS
jgi:coenzyme F420-reducing hydrogenase gamma subunit